MMRLTSRLISGLTGIACGVVAPILAAAGPAHADTPHPGVQFPFSANHVEYRLSHAQTVQVYNDKDSVLPICRSIVDSVEEMGIIFSDVNLLECGIWVPYCVDNAVQVGAQAASVVFSWDVGSKGCVFHMTS